MQAILHTINSDLRSYDMSQESIQSCFNDIEKNIETINGYACRILLIHLRNFEKICFPVTLDELIGDTCLYACNLAKKYIDKKLYEHHSGHNKRGYREDLYVPFSQYMQVMKMRIVQIKDKYCNMNPSSKLNKERIEIPESELTDDTEYSNDLLDILEVTNDQRD